jgi:hypothetical protein
MGYAPYQPFIPLFNFIIYPKTGIFMDGKLKKGRGLEQGAAPEKKRRF